MYVLQTWLRILVRDEQRDEQRDELRDEQRDELRDEQRDEQRDEHESIFGPLIFFNFRYIKVGVGSNNNIDIKKCTTIFLWE